MKKRCTKCGETKPAAVFVADRGQPDGLYSWCKACMAAHQREYRAAHPEYRAREKERIRQLRARRRSRGE